jgi:hypothetical protein
MITLSLAGSGMGIGPCGRSWYEIPLAAHTGLIPGHCANQSAGLTLSSPIATRLLEQGRGYPSRSQKEAVT